MERVSWALEVGTTTLDLIDSFWSCRKRFCFRDNDIKSVKQPFDIAYDRFFHTYRIRHKKTADGWLA